MPERPVRLRMLDSGAGFGDVTADRYRGDLHQAGIGNGWHSFEFAIPGGLSRLQRHGIQAQRAMDGQELLNSPQIVEAAHDAS